MRDLIASGRTTRNRADGFTQLDLPRVETALVFHLRVPDRSCPPVGWQTRLRTVGARVYFDQISEAISPSAIRRPLGDHVKQNAQYGGEPIIILFLLAFAYQHQAIFDALGLGPLFDRLAVPQPSVVCANISAQPQDLLRSLHDLLGWLA